MSKFKIINLEKDSSKEWDQTPEDTMVAIINNSVVIDESYCETVSKVMESEDKSMLVTDVLLQTEFGCHYIERLESGYIDTFPYFIKKSEFVNPFNPKIVDQVRNNQGKLIEHLSEPVFKYVKKIH